MTLWHAPGASPPSSTSCPRCGETIITEPLGDGYYDVFHYPDGQCRYTPWEGYYALDGGGGHIPSPRHPHDRTDCPMCGASLIAHTGRVNRWHWNHPEPTCGWKAGAHGGSTTIPADHTEWRAEWLAALPDVPGPNGATGQAADGTPVYLRHYALVPDLEEGGRATWLIDARSAADRIRTRKQRSDGYVTFRWLQARRSFTHVPHGTAVILDRGPSASLILIGKLYTDPGAGWGHLIDRDELRRGLACRSAKRHAVKSSGIARRRKRHYGAGRLTRSETPHSSQPTSSTRPRTASRSKPLQSSVTPSARNGAGTDAAPTRGSRSTCQ